MNSVVSVLTDPGAWVAGILFGIISTAIYKWFERLPRQIIGLTRSSRLKSLRRIRVNRENPLEAIRAIGNANAYFVAFLMMCLFYAGALLLSSSYRAILNESAVFGIACATPIFIFEVIWLNHDSWAKRLVQAHGHLLKYRARRELKS